jgi:hypothetical protein
MLVTISVPTTAKTNPTVKSLLPERGILVLAEMRIASAAIPSGTESQSRISARAGMSAGPLQLVAPPHRPPPTSQMNAGSVMAVARHIDTKPPTASGLSFGEPSSGPEGCSLSFATPISCGFLGLEAFPSYRPPIVNFFAPTCKADVGMAGPAHGGYRFPVLHELSC